MTNHFQRGLLLFEQRRYEQAIGELQLYLGQNSQDARAHSLVALCLSNLERYDEAAASAQQAIHLAPDDAFGFFALAQVLLERNRFADAQRAIEEAIRLDAFEADYFGILASIHLHFSHWKEALAAADQGLALEPEHNLCTNMRAQALVKLGDRNAAAATMGQALARRPDDPLTHANQGWALLNAGQPRQALEHFREALRLNPDLDWAKAGIVEALKARNFLYRWMLAYFLWMARLNPQVRWGLVIGALVAQQILGKTAAKNPQLAPYLLPVLYAYFAFVLLSWLAYPLFNLLLRLDRFGRHALSADQVRGANVLAVCILATLGCLIAAVASGIGFLYLVTLFLALLALPASAIYVCDAGWPRQAMVAITLGLLAAIGLVTVGALAEESLPAALQLPVVALLRILPFALLGSQFAAGYLSQVTPTR